MVATRGIGWCGRDASTFSKPGGDLIRAYAPLPALTISGTRSKTSVERAFAHDLLPGTSDQPGAPRESEHGRGDSTPRGMRTVFVVPVAGLAIINATGIYVELVADHAGERDAALPLHHRTCSRAF